MYFCINCTVLYFNSIAPTTQTIKHTQSSHSTKQHHQSLHNPLMIRTPQLSWSSTSFIASTISPQSLHNLSTISSVPALPHSYSQNSHFTQPQRSNRHAVIKQRHRWSVASYGWKQPGRRLPSANVTWVGPQRTPHGHPRGQIGHCSFT